MSKKRAYALLCAILGAALVVTGLVLFFMFFYYHTPGGLLPAPFVMGPQGVYFAAFSGCALVVWGGALLVAAREPALARGIGTASAVGLVLSALYRMMAWLLGDYASFGNVLRGEAALFLLLALAFVWLRPGRQESDVAARRAGATS